MSLTLGKEFERICYNTILEHTYATNYDDPELKDCCLKCLLPLSDPKHVAIPTEEERELDRKREAFRTGKFKSFKG